MRKVAGRVSNSVGLNRRDFLQQGMLGSAIMIASPFLRTTLEPHVPKASSRNTASMERPFELEEMTIADLQAGMKSGKWTAHSLTEMYLVRIEAIDKSGPAINAVIEMNPDALKIARALDQERKAKGLRGPLHGIPVLIKDNIATHDRMMTTAGSLALLGSIPPEDSFVVKKLREAGAVVLGKTNLSEWANFRSAHSTSGWSGRGGQTLNPYALDRNPCGSSSGSGAAVSANLSAVSVGTETDGSIVCPSSSNGVVGIKPTLGLVSRWGIIPIAHSQDTAGPICRTVTDAAILLGALSGTDAQDSITKENEGKSYTDYTRFLDDKGLKGARIGVVRKFFGFNDRVDQLMNRVLEDMRRAGAILIDPADMETTGKYDDSELEVLLYEFKADLNGYLTSLGPAAPVHSITEVIEFNERNKDKEMPYFGQDLMIKAEAKGLLTEKAYLEALEKNHQLSRKEGIDAVMEKHHLDAMVAPTGSPAWTTDPLNGDHFTGGSSTPAAVAGYPNINVPAGFIFGLPVGISFFGRAYSEPTLIKLAYSFEQHIGARKPPRFLPTADLKI
jgi:amidase